MIDVQRFKRIAGLSSPIIAGQISQNILNLVDLAMVGLLGTAAVAAVGMASYVNFVASAAVVALSSGVQAMAARRLGDGRTSETAIGLNGGLVMALVYAVPATILLVWLAADFFPLLENDPAVVEEAVPYMQARFVGIFAMGMNFSFRGYWSGMNQGTIYMRTLIFIHVSNIIISYILIFGALGAPELGTLGAGIGTTVSLYMGSLAYFWQAHRLAKGHGFLQRLPRGETFKVMLRVSLPTMVQMTLFAAGLVMTSVIIGLIGTKELAAVAVLMNIMLLAILPANGLGLAAASLVGQALGRGEPRNAQRWGWEVTLVGMAALAVIGLPMVLFPSFVLSGFLHDPAVIEIARLPLILMGVFMAFDAIGMVLMNAMLGAGAARTVMLVATGSQWLIFLPIAYLLGPHWDMGLTAVWLAFMLYRAIFAVILMRLWHVGAWASIRV